MKQVRRSRPISTGIALCLFIGAAIAEPSNPATPAPRPNVVLKRDLNPDYEDPNGPNGVTILAPREQPTSMQYPGVVPRPLGNSLPLFNLEDDPTESVDLAEKHPEVVRRLRDESQRFLKSMPAANQR